MKNSTLIFRSLIVILVLAGIAHYLNHLSFTTIANKDTEVTTNASSNSNEKKLNIEKSKISEESYLEGNWKVSYNTNDFKGSIVYEIKKDGEIFHAYTLQYVDEQGYSENADFEKALVIHFFNGSKGKGTYQIEYENEWYDVDCIITKVDDATFKLSYDYYGYSDVETWKKQ